MKTIKRIISLSLILIALVSSCGIPSLHPLYTKKDLILNKELEGTWTGYEEAQSTWKIWKDTLAFGEEGNYDKLYKLSHTQDEETVLFDLFLMRLGEYMYLDFFPDEYPDNILKNELGASHLFPVHTFARVEIKKDQIIIKQFNEEFLKNLINQNRIKISHEKSAGSILLTASPEELQKFVLKYADDENAYEEDIILKPKA